MSGGIVTDSSSVTQMLKRTGELSALASATLSDLDGMADHSVGNTITYAVALKNIGTTTVTSIKISSAVVLNQFERKWHGRRFERFMLAFRLKVFCGTRSPSQYFCVSFEANRYFW